MRKSTIVGSWNRLGLERLIHRRGDGLCLAPLDPPVAQGPLASSDGFARIVGRVGSFLASRHIHWPDGNSDDPVHAETVQGLANRKNELVLAEIHHDGVDAYQGSDRYLEAAPPAGPHRGAVSFSADCCNVLVAVGIEHPIEVGIDGNVAAEQQAGPDTRLVEAKEFGVTPDGAAVFEVALVVADLAELVNRP